MLGFIICHQLFFFFGTVVVGWDWSEKPDNVDVKCSEAQQMKLGHSVLHSGPASFVFNENKPQQINIYNM